MKSETVCQRFPGKAAHQEVGQHSSGSGFADTVIRVFARMDLSNAFNYVMTSKVDCTVRATHQADYVMPANASNHDQVTKHVGNTQIQDTFTLPVETVAWCRSSCKGVCPNTAAMTLVLDTRPKGAVQEGGGQKHLKAPILPCVIFLSFLTVQHNSLSVSRRALEIVNLR